MSLIKKLKSLPAAAKAKAENELAQRYHVFCCNSVKDKISGAVESNGILVEAMRFMCSAGRCHVGMSGAISDAGVVHLLRISGIGKFEASALARSFEAHLPYTTFHVAADWRVFAKSACIMPHHMDIIDQMEQALNRALRNVRRDCERLALELHTSLNAEETYEQFLDDGGFDVDENGNILE